MASDYVAVTVRDYNLDEGGCIVHLPMESSQGTIEALLLLMSATMSGQIALVTQGIQRYDSEDPGAQSDTGMIDIAAELIFLDGDAAETMVYLLAPAPASFDLEGQVDELNPAIANLIAWIIANATAPDGAILISYASGRKVTRQPGAVALFGAAARAGVAGIVADFTPQDGADIR